jgi:hypothetical protein
LFEQTIHYEATVSVSYDNCVTALNNSSDASLPDVRFKLIGFQNDQGRGVMILDDYYILKIYSKVLVILGVQ